MFGKKITFKKFKITFEVSDVLFSFFAENIIKYGKVWDAQYLKTIERLSESSLNDDTSLNDRINSNNIERNYFCRGNRNIIAFLKRFYINKNFFEVNQHSIIKKINFDILIKKDFDNLEKRKKTFLMNLENTKNSLEENPYYYLNKATYLYQIQQRKSEEFTISSKSLMNVNQRLLNFYFP